MDAVHRPDDLGFVSSEIFVRQFYEDAVTAYTSDPSSVTWNGNVSVTEQYHQKLDVDGTVSEATIEELDAIFDPSGLMCGLDDPGDPISENIPDTDLTTLRCQSTDLGHRKDGTKYRQYIAESLKYRKLVFNKTTLSPEQQLRYIPEDVILTVLLLKPYNKPLDQWQIKLGRLLTMDCAFTMRGRDHLSTLMSSIKCPADVAMTCPDYSQEPNKTEHTMAQDAYPSRFLYINETFYSDMSDPRAIDHTQAIIEWCKKKGRALGPFESRSVKGVTLMDLELRLGYPYLYMHQGSCEHLLVFTDIRLMHPASDPIGPTDRYPMQISTPKCGKAPKCATCKKFSAKWVVYGDDTLPVEVLFQCAECFRAFNYDADGNKARDFKCIPCSSILA